jgi:hypothetical protein
MNDDQLYYFLVDKNTRNVLQIEYPSDIDEFNKILGTSEGKGSLLKDLGIILSSENKTFKNPDPVIRSIKENSVEEIVVEKPNVIKEKQQAKKSQTKNTATTVKKKTVEEMPTQVNLFAGLFD